MKIRFSLFRYSYSLTVTPRYAGAIATRLKPRPGEDWLRGSDLRDGPLWRFPAVLWDIAQHASGFGRWRSVWPKRKSWPKQRQVIKRNGQFYDA